MAAGPDALADSQRRRELPPHLREHAAPCVRLAHPHRRPARHHTEPGDRAPVRAGLDGASGATRPACPSKTGSGNARRSSRSWGSNPPPSAPEMERVYSIQDQGRRGGHLPPVGQVRRPRTASICGPASSRSGGPPERRTSPGPPSATTWGPSGCGGARGRARCHPRRLVHRQARADRARTLPALPHPGRVRPGRRLRLRRPAGEARASTCSASTWASTSTGARGRSGESGWWRVPHALPQLRPRRGVEPLALQDPVPGRGRRAPGRSREPAAPSTTPCKSRRRDDNGRQQKDAK